MSKSVVEIKKEVEVVLDRLATMLPGFRVREAQRAMMMAIVDVLMAARAEDDAGPADGSNIGVIEAPTGVGKSLATALPSLIVARETGRKVVISSATVALQEQLINKDLPLLAKAMTSPCSFALAKGRGRYACPVKIMKLTGGLAQDDMFGNAGTFTHKPTESDTQILEKITQDMQQGKWDGDRDSLEVTVSDRLWSNLAIERAACPGRNCAQARNCPYFRAREGMQKADLIVANHDLVLADLKLGGGRLLPAPNKSFYILDEAHNLPAKAVNAFSGSHTMIGMQKILSRIPRAVTRALGSFPSKVDYRPVPDLCESLSASFDDLMAIFDHDPNFQNLDQNSRNLPTLRFHNGNLPTEIKSHAQNVYKQTDTLFAKLALLKEEMDAAHAENTDQAINDLTAEIGILLSRVENILEVWTMMLAEASGRQVPAAKWIGMTNMGGGSYDYTVNAASISAADKLSQMLWSKVSASILTSATLTAMGEFRMILRRTGLFRLPEVTTLKLESPFDYQKNAKLIIPALKADPKNAQAHTNEIIALLPKLIQDDGEGTLVLFTSRKQMEDVFYALPIDLQKMIFVQGKALSKGEIIVKHCKRIDKKKTSIIFGLDSFAEGIDLKGAYCVHVIIAKIPFAAPVDPVEEATAEWLKKMGGNPFIELSVPAACIKMVQSAGRLLRTETDTGKVTVLDRRLTTERYGQSILKSLPPFLLQNGDSRG